LHDFSPWTLPNGLFWIVKVDDSAVQIEGDTLTIHLVDVPVVDARSFPPPPQAVPGVSPIPLIPAKLSLDIVYKRTGSPRRVRPTSHDPLSPFHWAGMMWDSTNSGKFSLTYEDNSFSASGSFDSTGNFGEMGYESNGIFLGDDQGDSNHNPVDSLPHPSASMQMGPWVAGSAANRTGKTVLLKGRVPVNVSF
jgi:hypothetical protein